MNPIMRAPSPHSNLALIATQRPHLKTPFYRCLKLQPVNGGSGEIYNTVHNSRGQHKTVHCQSLMGPASSSS